MMTSSKYLACLGKNFKITSQAHRTKSLGNFKIPSHPIKYIFTAFGQFNLLQPTLVGSNKTHLKKFKGPRMDSTKFFQVMQVWRSRFGNLSSQNNTQTCPIPFLLFVSNQCDQIGRFLKLVVNKLTFKRSPSIF